MTDAVARVHRLLQQGGHTVATAESLTGGRLAALLTETPGASATYVGGVVAYATTVKEALLGVSPEIVRRHGVVSAECATAMARGVQAATGATYAVSTTGVAGPDRQEGHPPGTVFIGLVGPRGSSALSLELVGARPVITQRTCAEALSALADMLGSSSASEETGLR